MNALTQIERDLVEETLAGFSAGALEHYWPAANGIENSNYFVTTSTGEYVLTVLEQPPAAGGAYVGLLDALAEAGLPVPAPLPQSGGDHWAEVAGKPALLQPRLPGSHVTNPTSANLTSIGRFCARLHKQAHALREQLPEYPRNSSWLSQVGARVMPFLPFTQASLLEEALARISSTLKREDVTALPSSVIHGDLFRDNVLFREDTLSGVLDFHHAAHGYALFDLCVIVNDWCCDDGGQLDGERALALLQGYHAERKLTRAELWFFPLFAIYAATAFWLSRLDASVRARQGEMVRQKNPEEFHRIVRHHMAHFFYIDERLLERG